MRHHHLFSYNTCVLNQLTEGFGRVVIGSAVVGSVVVSSTVGGLLGTTTFFAVEGLTPSQGTPKYFNEAGGNIYGDSRFNVDADPRFNSCANPRFSINGSR